MAKRSRKSVMQHQFSEVPKADIPRSSFDRSHGYKTTFDAGLLIPILVDEALPGDTFNLRMTGFARLSTPIFPIMDNLWLDTHFFFVPNRLLWDNWERFNGSQDDPGDSTDFIIPVLNSTNFVEGSLADYMGLPTTLAGGAAASSLWHRAYNLIWNEWFRDQNLQDSVTVPLGNGPDESGLFPLARRGKRHDYFTSCLPWPQKGDSVSLPLGTIAPVLGLGMDTAQAGDVASGTVTETGGGTTSYAFSISNQELVSKAMFTELVDGTPPLEPAIFADLTNATAATINQLRQAFQIQKLLERDARGGTRYTEIVRAHFGVTSPDARLQRPEYLGGGTTPVIISPVAQTTSTDATSPQGNLAAFGTASMSNHGFTKSFTEHGVIIGLLSARADLTYQQGTDRMWSRSTRFDFYWPALSHIGEQAVTNREIFTQGTAADDLVFGYQERYAEYRYKPSKITGAFRSNAASGTLDAWHLSQDFSLLPVLDSAFIEENPPIDRVIAVPAEPHFIFDSYFSMRCARPMPMYGVPGFIDHF